MINEQVKQAIFNGEFGITREGKKAKFLGRDDKSDKIFWYCIYTDDSLVDDFRSYSSEFVFNNNTESRFDIVGLWKDKLEPFDLEKALAGHPVKLRNGNKAFVTNKFPDDYKGYYPIYGYRIITWDGTEYESLEDPTYELEKWKIDGSYFDEGESTCDIIGMWK